MPPKDRDRDWRFRTGSGAPEAPSEAHDEISGVHEAAPDAADEHPEITDLKALVRRTRGALFSKLEDFGGRLDSFESDFKAARSADINYRRETSNNVKDLQEEVETVKASTKSAEIQLRDLAAGVGQLLISSKQDDATREARARAAAKELEEAEERAAKRKRENLKEERETIKSRLQFWLAVIAALTGLATAIMFGLRGNPPSVTVPTPLVVPQPLPVPVAEPKVDH